MGEFAKQLLKWVVPLLALAAMLAGAYTYGKADGVSSRQQEVDDLTLAKTTYQGNALILQGKVDVYAAVTGQVESLRQDLKTQNEQQAKVILDRLGVMGKLVLTRTGDECKDARSVANAYFDQLEKEARAGK